MSTQQPGNLLSKPATSALTGKQFYIAKIDSAGGVVLSAAATNRHAGVIQNSSDVPAGAQACVQTRGSSKVIYGGTVDEGDWLTSDSNGKAVATTTDKDVVLGKCLKAGVSGDIGEVDIEIFTLSI